MATVHLLCGKTGSGKTTLARQLEGEGAVRFSLDDWIIHLYGHRMTHEEFDERVVKCMDLMLSMTEQVAARGVSVVLDCGFWKKADRRGTRTRLERLGVRVMLHYLHVPDLVLLERLAKRNRCLPAGTFEITPEMFADFSGRFESPGEDENPVVVRQHGV